MWAELDDDERYIYISGEGWKSCEIDGDHIWISDDGQWYSIDKDGKNVYIFNRN